MRTTWSNIMSKQRNTALTFTIALAATSLTQAATPYLPDLVTNGNRWTITGYDDSSTVHTELATQGICFYATGNLGTQQLYEWVSDTFPNWKGRAAQEGDQIFMHGDFANLNIHDSMQWQIVTSSTLNLGTGHWIEWASDGSFGSTIGFANAKLERVGSCERSTAKEALDFYKNINFPLDKDGNEITTPIGAPLLIRTP